MPLACVADLTVDLGSTCVHVHGEGTRLFVEVPDVLSAVRLIRSVRAVGRLRQLMRKMHRILQQTGLSITLKTPHRQLLTLGPERGTLLLRFIGIPGVSIHAG